MARRKFAPALSTVYLQTDRGDCLKELLDTLPVNYDLFASMSRTFLSIKWMVDLTLSDGKRGNNMSSETRDQLTNFTNNLYSELAHLISITSIKGHKGRTQYIEQFMPSISMMIGIASLKSGVSGISQLFTNLRLQLKDQQHVLLLQSVGDFCNMICDENVPPLTPAVVHDVVEETLDIAGPWDWGEWQAVDQALIDFFLADDSCAGHLQDMLRHQLSYGSQ